MPGFSVPPRNPAANVNLRIRTKFIGILIIAAVLPLGIALVAVNVIGYRYYRKSQGVLFQSISQSLAHTLSTSINRNIELCDDWLMRAGLHQHLNRHDDKLLQKLKTLQASNPLFVAILATDAEGQVLASTRKPAPPSQAKEKWWMATIALKHRNVYVEGINKDSDADVHSIDLCMPVSDPAAPDAPPLGVIKFVLNAPSMLLSLEPVLSKDDNLRQVLFGNGSVPLRLFSGHFAPLEEHIDARAVNALARKRMSWSLAALDGQTTSLVGYSALNLITSINDTASKYGTSPICVMVYNDASVVFGPVRTQMWMLGGAGTLLIAGFFLTGYYLAGQKIIDPIEKLRSAVHGIAASAKLDGSAQNEVNPQDAKPTSDALHEIEKIHTGDEIEELSHEFGYMASRVLSYHNQLETEIALQTAEIHGDLQVAKEFQEALMPRHYPAIPASPKPGGLHLNFNHVYKPASTVGGDFFDVLRLSEHRAGIFIADVMGHGTRSALVTAILRTLVQQTAFEIKDPAIFLKVINRHFHAIVKQSGELLFASAFYLIIDTTKATAAYASAGHPSPVFAERCRRKVGPLFNDLKNNPALGLFPDSTYARQSKTLTAGDIFVLFTDGVFEATDADGEEFGQRRLREAIAAHIDGGMNEITQAVVRKVNEFVGLAALPDDLCIVAVEVAATPMTAQVGTGVAVSPV